MNKAVPSTFRITNNLSRRINTAVILAAGARAMMNPYTVDKLKQDRLKPVIDIASKPPLHWTLEKNGCTLELVLRLA
jgi:hypothetical protein